MNYKKLKVSVVDIDFQCGEFISPFQGFIRFCVLSIGLHLMFCCFALSGLDYIRFSKFILLFV